MSAEMVSVLEREEEDLLLDLAALLGGGADNVDGIRIHQADVADDGDLRVVLAAADDNGRAVYLRMLGPASHSDARPAAPTDPGLTVHTDLGDFVSLGWLRTKGLLR